MAFLARKISRAKWEGSLDGPISADALTCDLKTANNTLSFWRFGIGEERAYEDAALALASGQQELDKIDIVSLDETELLQEASLELSNSDGSTPVLRLKPFHVDAVALDVDRIVHIARIVARRVRSAPSHVKRFSKVEVREILKRAIFDGHLSAEALQQKLRTALGL